MGVKRHLSSSLFNSQAKVRAWVWDRLRDEAALRLTGAREMG